MCNKEKCLLQYPLQQLFVPCIHFCLWPQLCFYSIDQRFSSMKLLCFKLKCKSIETEKSWRPHLIYGQWPSRYLTSQYEAKHICLLSNGWATLAACVVCGGYIADLLQLTCMCPHRQRCCLSTAPACLICSHGVCLG